MKHVSLAVLAAALCLWTGLAAASHTDPFPRNATTPSQFPALAAKVRADMQPGGRYLVNDAQRAEIDQRLDAMQKLLEGHDSVDQLTQQQQLDLFNNQERVNAVLTQRDGDEKICSVQTQTGSAIAQRTCDTRRQLEARSADGANTMQEVHRSERATHGAAVSGG
ncbi:MULTISPECIES: hypothetical protein [Dyella]|uniref:Uncharacterized protein n=2 Tax=Dyella TaxID=231454 RepID=A0A4R0YHY2_9GAMM|nr:MULTISPECIES: hypothetical protein [Dyella]TBR36930.1 hypothetical protein EYV96_13615 [Dyella terrae]TCI07979.1 hypothetical protein EZM97_25255 [Dyella soli]